MFGFLVANKHLITIKEIRDSFSAYIKKWHKNDDRVILSLSFDGIKINAEWIELKKYLKFKSIES